MKSTATVYILMVISLAVVPDMSLAHGGQEKSQSNSLSETQKYGTDPTRYFLPNTAINTTDVPNIVLKPSDKNTDPLPHYKVATDSYLFFGNIARTDQYNRGWNGNAGFVVTKDGVVVIDSLGTPRLGRRMIATIRTITDQPVKFLIITHNHPDHSYGAIAFRNLAGVKVIGHTGTLEYINSNKIDRSVAYRRRMIKKDMTGFKPVKPDITLPGKRFSKYVLTIGGKIFEIFNTGQHHSYGDLVVYQTDEKIVWISDLAFNQRTTFMGDGNSRQANEAQDWLIKKFPDAKLMIPGHGSAQTPPFPMVRKTQSYIKRLRAFMGRAIDDGLDILSAVDQADSRAEFRDWRNTRLYGLNHRANANFVYRELEQEKF